jgi:hypothetical protein
MDEAYSDRRPLAVMFNNLKAALPMYGIAKADIIYEALAEGGITRVMGFYKNPALVPRFGSIRSTRAYYLDIAQAHDAILMHAGGSPEALGLISKRKMLTLDGIRYDGSMCYRDPQRRRSAGLEHSLFAKGQDVEDTITKLSSRIDYEKDYDASDAFDFADTATPGGNTAAKEISVRFSQYKTGVFEYDASDGLYYVSQHGGPMTDGEDGEQVRVKNVLVLYTSVSLIKGDPDGRLATKMTGTGKGTFFCDGKAEEIAWSKDGPESPYVYTHTDGAPLKLARGVSYINIVPSDAKVIAS